MKASKTLTYRDRRVDLDLLRQSISSYLKSDGFKIQEPKLGQNRMLIQAQKGGFLRELISAERALNILIEGSPEDFTVQIGIGKWIQNIGVTAIETVLISELFLPLDVAEILWNFEVENKIAKRIDHIVENLSTSMQRPAPDATVPAPATESPAMQSEAGPVIAQQGGANSGAI
jgi:hypothetical protein